MECVEMQISQELSQAIAANLREGTRLLADMNQSYSSFLEEQLIEHGLLQEGQSRQRISLEQTICSHVEKPTDLTVPSC